MVMLIVYRVYHDEYCRTTDPSGILKFHLCSWSGVEFKDVKFVFFKRWLRWYIKQQARMVNRLMHGLHVFLANVSK